MKRKLSLLVLLASALVFAAGPVGAAPRHPHAKVAKVSKSAKLKSAKLKLAKLKAAKSRVAKVTNRHRRHAAAAAVGGATVAAAEARANALSYAEVKTGKLRLQSSSVVVQDQASGEMLFEKNPDAVVPIASISKLMTAMVTLDGQPDMGQPIEITEADVDTLKHSSSHLPVGTQLSREDVMRLALMASENRAAHALARTYPGGEQAFVAAMNRKAEQLGLKDTRFYDPTGLNAGNVSSARDLAKMVAAAAGYARIREFSTTAEYDVPLGRRSRTFHNTNMLVRNGTWDIGVSKTGYINESGRCLVMQAILNNKPTIIVLLDSWGKLSRIGDANRIKRWIEANESRAVRG